MAKKETELLRKAMREKGVNLCVIPTADAHDSEYPCEYFEARKFISGFTGSAGTLAVSDDWAGLFTDGRYFIQAEKQLKGSGIKLYRMGEAGVPSIENEIEDKLPEGGTIAADGRVIGHSFGTALKAAAEAKGGSLIFEDMPGLIWDERPKLPDAPVYPLEISLTGESRASKLARVREKMAEKNADVHVLTTLDDIAWITNLRGSDLSCTPVFLSFMVIGTDTAFLYMRKPPAVRDELAADGVITRSYENFYDDLPELTRGKRVLADEDRINELAYSKLSGADEIINSENPSTLMKAVKNETELAHMKEAHIKDGIAVTRFLRWVKENVGKEDITEMSAADKLDGFREREEGYMGPSFDTISACGANGAIIHYGVTHESNAQLKAEGFYMADCGGQYRDGTTDVTRTIALGPLTEAQKRHFTAVLKGMLAVQDAKFMAGCRGFNLDYLAREHLWAMGLDYRHGTGHGVGYLLGDHEPPVAIRWKETPQTPEFAPGMIVSDEPGIYLEGEYGIRTENLLLVKRAEETEYGSFLSFEPITMVPIDKDAIAWEDMRDEDRERLNSYHGKVWEALSPHLEGDELKWLKEAAAPV